MRIGIVTQPLEMNYGGILQNWALQQVLKSLGHDPITIDAYQRYSTPHYVFNCLRVLLKGSVRLPKRYRGSLRNKLMGQFIEEHISKTKVMWGYRSDIVKRYKIDALVVGSDQVWRYAYNQSHIEDMYLSFAKMSHIRKRVAYAASFGVDHWEYPQGITDRCAALAHRFDAISVRESSGMDLCREHLGVNVQCVLDPTLLLGAKDYQAIIDENWDTKEPYLAVYCLDMTPEKESLFNQLARSHGLKVQYYSAGWQSTLTIGQWLAMIKNASVIVTDSFHGTVFSILFEKEFYAISNQGRGYTRLAWLLQQLGLEDRLMRDSASVKFDVSPINWREVISRLEECRMFSKDFLSASLA